MNSRPVLILGLSRALVKSDTDRPVSLLIFCAPVLSGMMAWSEVRSCLNCRLPKCSTADTTRKMAGGGGGGGDRQERVRGDGRGEEAGKTGKREGEVKTEEGGKEKKFTHTYS